METHKIGFIGLGGMGRVMFANMAGHPRFDVVAAWDPGDASRALALELEQNLTLVDDAQAVIGDASVSVIYISSPPTSHGGYIEAAVAAGKAVYCEKPLGVDVVASRRVAELVAASGLPNIVNFNHGNAVSTTHIEAERAADRIGDIAGADAFIHLTHWPRDFQETATWLAGRTEGGFTREMLSHWIYLTRRLLGEGRLLSAHGRFPLDGVGAETYLTAELEFGGVPMHIKAAVGGAGPVGTTYTLWGEKRSFRLSSGGRIDASDGGAWTDATPHIDDAGAEDHRRTLDAVAQRLDGEDNAMPTIADALAVQVLVEEILQTAAAG